MSTKLDEALDLLAKAADLHTRGIMLGTQHAKDNAPYKVGDRVFSMCWMAQSLNHLAKFGENSVVTEVSFRPDSNFEAKCVIHVQPYTKDWRPHARKNGWRVSDPLSICKIEDKPDYIPQPPVKLVL